MERKHQYEIHITWTGNIGTGTEHYTGYKRDHLISSSGKPAIEASSDQVFRGDAAKYNPEELFVASLSSCHMLWFLHLCSEAGVIVEKYTDHALGTMIVDADGGGRFTQVTLFPQVLLRETPKTDLNEIHSRANKLCFIANSCNFFVHHQAGFSIIDQ